LILCLYGHLFLTKKHTNKEIKYSTLQSKNFPLA
jgi:hypothetical protein